MSELFMECVEEELEPWQKQVPEVTLIEEDDDEPIFVGVLCMCYINCLNSIYQMLFTFNS